MRLIRILADSEIELTMSALSRRANLNHTSASRMVNELMELGLVHCRQFGRMRLFKLNPLDRRAQLLRELLAHGFR